MQKGHGPQNQSLRMDGWLSVDWSWINADKVVSNLCNHSIRSLRFEWWFMKLQTEAFGRHHASCLSHNGWMRGLLIGKLTWPPRGGIERSRGCATLDGAVCRIQGWANLLANEGTQAVLRNANTSLSFHREESELLAWHIRLLSIRAG